MFEKQIKKVSGGLEELNSPMTELLAQFTCAAPYSNSSQSLCCCWEQETEEKSATVGFAQNSEFLPRK